MSVKRLTIDHTRGVYVQQDDTGTREYPYRSRRSANHTASYLHWRGYTVLIINEPNNTKKKGVHDVFDFTAIEDPQYVADRLRVFAERGSNFITASHREKFCTLGLLERKGRGLRLTAKGQALMGQYPPTGDASANGHVKPEPAPNRLIFTDNWGDAVIKMAENWGETPQPAPANPQPPQPDSTRAALLGVRATLLGVIREHLPAPIQPLADEVTRINALLED